MKFQNEGAIDRFLRVIAAAALLGLAFAGIPAAPWLYASVAVAAILAITGLAGFCPLYAVLRLSTKPIRH
jgi:Inner membrane protein YgaP-like, transmembrane domain